MLRICLARLLPFLALVGCVPEAAPSLQPLAQQAPIEIALLPEEPRQTIHGFGASDAWSIQFVGRDWPVAKRERIADLLFSRDLREDGSPEGIGLSIWRFNIGAGSAAQGTQSGIDDEWRRAESFLRPDGSYDWSRQEGQRWFLRAAQDRGVERFVGFSNSPPVHLTRNGRAHSSGGDAANLPPERFDDFADFLTRVTLHLQESEGVRLDYLSPVNEPQWDWKGGQEGSPWLNTEIHHLVRELSRSLLHTDLPTRIEIAEAGKLDYLFENADRPRRGDQIAEFFRPASPLFLGDLPNLEHGIAAHSYFTTYGSQTLFETRSRVRSRLREIDPSLEFWMTEYCVLEDNPEIKGRGRDLGMATALYVARVIHADLTVAEASSWNWWLAVSPYDYKDGLVYIDRNPTDGEIYESKLLWALGHFSRFVRPGMRRIEVRRSDSMTAAPVEGGLLVSAYREPESSRMVAVLVNQDARETPVRLDLGPHRSYRVYLTAEAAGDDLRSLGERSITEPLVLPPRSLVTVVTPLSEVS